MSCKHTYYQPQAHPGKWQCVHCGELIDNHEHTNHLIRQIETLRRELRRVREGRDK